MRRLCLRYRQFLLQLEPAVTAAIGDQLVASQAVEVMTQLAVYFKCLPDDIPEYPHAQ